MANPWDETKYTTPPVSDPPKEEPEDQSLGAFLRQVPEEKGVWGPIDRFGLGVIQSAVGPLEQGAKWTGLDKKLPSDMQQRLGELQKASQGPMGTAGEIAGVFTNPLYRVIRPIQALNEIGGPAVRAISRIAQSTIAGGIGGAISQPGDTKSQAGWGAAIGGALGLPGATAAALGFPNVQALAGRITNRIPFVRDALTALKAGGEAAFNRFWWGHALAPIRGRTPATGGFDGAADVERQIGTAIDRSTAGMTLDARPGTTAMAALNNTMRVARGNILDAGAWDRYNDIIRDVVVEPLGLYGGRLGPTQLRAAASNLQAAIREIRPDSEAQRTLRFELEQFRMRMLDNTLGGDRNAYRNARLAWSRFATGRDAIPLGSKDGIFSPDDLAAEIDKREPLRYGSGRARDQATVNAAQQATAMPTRAARQAAAGQPPGDPANLAARGGAAAAPVVSPRTDIDILSVEPGPR